MKVYELDKNGFYIGDIPFFDPTNAPKYYTTVKLEGAFHRPRFDGVKWVEGDKQENHIGKTVYRITDRQPLLIQTLGPIPDGYTQQIPKEFDKWDGSLWITDTILRNKTLKARKLAEINQDLELALAQLRSDYPESEIMSWTKQEGEARRWIANNSTPTPLIDRIVEMRGVNKVDLINKIILKADQYAYAVGMAVGRRQYLEDRIMAVPVGKEAELEQYQF